MRSESVDKLLKWFKTPPSEIMVLESNVEYDEHMDEECIPLCNALNAVKGIVTTESCCGHGKSHFRIWFKATSFRGLFFVARCVDRRYFRHRWDYTVSVGDMVINNILPTSFLLSTRVNGEEAYKQAEDLVENMNIHLNHKNFMKGFDLTPDDFEWRYYERQRVKRSCQ
jgi:hypothetical protein